MYEGAEWIPLRIGYKRQLVVQADSRQKRLGLLSRARYAVSDVEPAGSAGRIT
jgi:hypothetical protein